MIPAIERLAVEERVRGTVCVECLRRPPHSDRWAASISRDCEDTCPVFENLAQLQQIVRDAASGSIHRHELRVLHEVCRDTCIHKRDGGQCWSYADADCPLSQRGGQTAATLGALANHGDDAEPAAWRARGERL